jgi:hypothetical protein
MFVTWMEIQGGGIMPSFRINIELSIDNIFYIMEIKVEDHILFLLFGYQKP